MNSCLQIFCVCIKNSSFRNHKVLYTQGEAQTFLHPSSMILCSFRCYYENKLQIVVIYFIQWPFDVYLIHASTHYNSKGNQKEIMTISAVPWIITRFRLLLFTLMVPAHLVVQHRGKFSVRHHRSWLKKRILPLERVHCHHFHHVLRCCVFL